MNDDEVYQGVDIPNRPPIDTSERHCKICDKKLSMYNLSEYCFTHQLEGRVRDDKLQDEKERKGKERWNRNLLRRQKKERKHD